MKDLFAELIKRFGLWAILVLIIVGALVWLIVHLSAEQGEKVSIFFGMIEYTKGKSQPEPKPELEAVRESELKTELEIVEGTSLTGSITFPHPGSRVARKFRVEGTVLGPYRHLWLIERVGHLHYPKEPELKPHDGSWVGEVNEGGQPPGGRFEVLLVDVSIRVSKYFVKWLRNGHRTGHYPGLLVEDIGDAKVIDTKGYQLITE